MNKALVLLSACGFFYLGTALTGCSPKTYPTQAANTMRDTGYVAFTKMLKQRMENDHVDIRKVQFYLDQSLVLRRTMGAERGNVSGGTVAFNNGQSYEDIAIPAYTPAVCEKVSGDSLFISFDASGSTLIFSALYANQYFTVSSPYWYNGVGDVMYNNQNYKVMCPTCGSATNAHLVMRKMEQNNNKPANITKTVSGRMVK